MKRLYSIICFVLMAIAMTAQPGVVKKTSKGVLKVTTFKSDGTLLATGYGAFIDADGIALTAWTPFVGASSAVVIDGQGKKYDVDCIFGASAIYNVARIRVKKEPKSTIQPLQLEQDAMAVGGEAWVVGYEVKSPKFTKMQVHEVETFNTDMPYYIFEQTNGEIKDEHIGMPFVNTQGQLMGLTNTSSTRTDLYVACARYAQSLQPSLWASNDNVLRNTNVRIALPNDYNGALLAMMLASQKNDSINYPATVEDFIALFPDKEEGYEYKANMLTDKQRFEEADAMMQKAIEVSQNKDNAHYTFSKLIYNKELLMSDIAFEPWTLDKAISEIDQAIAINPIPTYSVHKGRVLFSKKQYEDALHIFNEICASTYRDADVYYYAYQCLKSMNKDQDKQVEMLDSSIVIAPRQLTYKAEKALLLMKMNRNADAIGVCKDMVTQNPYYAEAHGLLGLALCRDDKKEVGVAELKRAKQMGYIQAEAFLRKYDKPSSTPAQNE